MKVPGLALFIHFINTNPLPCLPPSPLLLPAHRGHIHPPKRAPWGDWNRGGREGRREGGGHQTHFNFKEFFSHFWPSLRRRQSEQKPNLCRSDKTWLSFDRRNTESLIPIPRQDSSIPLHKLGKDLLAAFFSLCGWGYGLRRGFTPWEATEKDRDYLFLPHFL